MPEDVVQLTRGTWAILQWVGTLTAAIALLTTVYSLVMWLLGVTPIAWRVGRRCSGAKIAIFGTGTGAYTIEQQIPISGQAMGRTWHGGEAANHWRISSARSPILQIRGDHGQRRPRRPGGAGGVCSAGAR